MAQNTEGSTRWLHGNTVLVFDGRKYWDAEGRGKKRGQEVNLTPAEVAALKPAKPTFTATPARQAKPPARVIRGPGAYLGSGATA